MLRARSSRRRVVMVGALVATMLGGASGAHMATANLMIEVDCPIEDQTVLLDPDDGRTIDLDVLVLLDGVTQARAEQVFADVDLPYAELGIDVVPTYQVADPPFTEVHARELMLEAKRRFADFKVPAEYDIVEVLTSKDITGATGSGVAGSAYCLGGISDDAKAFEVSEAGTAEEDNGTRVVPQLPATVMAKKKAAKVTAHEMGHLLGGQHYYANCVEGIDQVNPAGELSDKSPCTLMWPEVSPSSLHFGELNGRIVRGYALRYATANDA